MNNVTGTPAYSGPGQARLNNKQSSQGVGAWVPENPEGYLEVDFGHVMEIREIATQGHPTKNMFVHLYSVKYTVDGKTWKVYIDVSISWIDDPKI